MILALLGMVKVRAGGRYSQIKFEWQGILYACYFIRKCLTVKAYSCYKSDFGNCFPTAQFNLTRS